MLQLEPPQNLIRTITQTKLNDNQLNDNQNWIKANKIKSLKTKIEVKENK